MNAKRVFQVALAVGAMAGPATAQEPSSGFAQHRAQVDSLVARFYERRGGRLAWSDSAGTVSVQARALLGGLQHCADRRGQEALTRDDHQHEARGEPHHDALERNPAHPPADSHRVTHPRDVVHQQHDVRRFRRDRRAMGPHREYCPRTRAVTIASIATMFAAKRPRSMPRSV